MLTDICQYLKNWFADDKDKQFDKFTIENGRIAPLNNLQNGQYYRIIGSVFNDGVHRSDDILTDELEFEGAIWLMRIPPVILDLDAEISEWIENHKDALASPYQSESFGGYSYSVANSNSASGVVTWQSQFADRLSRWRKIG